MTDGETRTRLTDPVTRYISQLGRRHADQIVDTVRSNPGAIHALHDHMSHVELLATAVVFLWKGIATLDEYAPSAPTIVDQCEAGND